MPARLALTTAYSLLWGPTPADKLFGKLAGWGVTKTAITDRDNLLGYPVFREEAQRYGIELICGASLTEGSAVIHAFVQDRTGYERLCYLLTKRNLDPRFSYLSALLEDSGNLVLATTHAQTLRLLALKVKRLYGAVTPTCLTALQTARNLGLPLLACDEALLLDKQDEELHKILRCIALHKTVGSLADGDFVAEPNMLLEPKQWEEAFCCWPEAVHNAETLLAYDPFPPTPIFPDYPVPDSAKELEERVFKGAEQRYGEINDAILERIRYELSIIAAKGFAPYFLIMHDIVRLSSRTCGRGSGAASIVSYCLYITNVDPIAHHLYFERFLSPSRQDPPDIDVDFAWDERDGVFAAVFQRFGQEHCARVANHNTFRLRSAVRETARSYGLSDSQISEGERHLFVDGLKCLDDPLWQTICRIAGRLEGLPKEISMHCGGLVITPRPVVCYAPILRSSDGYPLLCWEKEGTESAGFVKIDLLGNRSLAVIRDTLANLSEDNIHIDERLWHPIEDPKTVEALARGDSMGVFYIESPAMRQLQRKTGCGDFEHIVIHSSIIRPAANKFITEYVERLKGKSWEPLHPRLAYILDETYGILCYQEDVSKTAVALAGFSEADADKLRKIIAKKAGEKLRVYKDQFFNGCKANKVSEETTAKIWEMMLSFDGYSFCKPHSASYAMVSFQSAYLRVHHGAYFMAAVLSNQGGYYRSQAYISEAHRMGIHVEGPDLNLSRIHYHAHDNTLIVGLMAIANLTDHAKKAIVQERNRNGRFTDLADAASRLDLTREDWVCLVASGCCDSLNPGLRRSDQLRLLLTRRRQEPSSAQMELFAVKHPIILPTKQLAPTYRPTEDELHQEFSSLGFLRSHHPLLLWSRFLQGQPYIKACDIPRYVGRFVRVAGYQITQKQILTQGGESMCFVSFEDETALYETVIFPDLYQRFYPLLASMWPLEVFGKVQNEQGALVLEIQHLKKIGEYQSNRSRNERISASPPNAS